MKISHTTNTGLLQAMTMFCTMLITYKMYVRLFRFWNAFHGKCRTGQILPITFHDTARLKKLRFYVPPTLPPAYPYCKATSIIFCTQHSYPYYFITYCSKSKCPLIQLIILLRNCTCISNRRQFNNSNFLTNCWDPNPPSHSIRSPCFVLSHLMF
jgi:hypothetical protein